MRIVDVKDAGEKEIRRLLQKAAFDEVELSPAMREGNRKLFGSDLTASQVAARIVEDVRREGDAAVMKYTKLLDHAEFTPEEFLVSEEEFDAAEKAADPKVVKSLQKASPMSAAITRSKSPVRG